ALQHSRIPRMLLIGAAFSLTNTSLILRLNTLLIVKPTSPTLSAQPLPAVFVPDSKPLDELLRDMQRNRNHMALLVDEYGAIAGLVTIEDVLEEIVGEIADEYDTDEVAPVEDLGDNRFRVSARLPIEDVGELYGLEFEEDL